MNTRSTNRSQMKTGSALLTTMGIVFLIAAVAAGMVAMGRQEVFSSIRLRDYVKAQMIAEAGVNDAYNELKTNWAARLDAAKFPLTSFDGGHYDATVFGVGSNTASITSTGLYGTATATVRADIQNIITTTTNGATIPGVGPFGFAILSGGNVSWAGNSDMEMMSNGFIHANGSYEANGVNTVRGNVESSVGISLIGAAAITGTAKAPVVEGAHVGSEIEGPVPVVPVPNIDLTPYYNAALANNQVFSGTKTISGTVTPAGGIMWVNGNLIIQEGTFNGCFIATGTIEMKAAANDTTIALNQVNNYPVLASRDGSILVKQAKLLTFDGLIYVKTGGFDKQGAGDVEARGSIIAAGNVSKVGEWSGFIYSDPTPAPPGGHPQYTADKVVVTAWQD